MAKVRDFALDKNGDMAVVNGDFATVADAAAVPQGVQIRLRFFAGENWLDQAQGIPYLDVTNPDGSITPGILTQKNPNAGVVRELLREAIADTPDVVDIAASDLVDDIATRQASVSYNVATVYGAPLVSGQVPLP